MNIGQLQKLNRAKWTICAGVSIGAIPPALVALMLSSAGNKYLYFAWCIVLPMAMMIMAGLVFLTILLICSLLLPSARPVAMRLLFVSVFLLVSSLFGLFVAIKVRDDLIAQVPRRASALITAIQKYQLANGAPPERLDQLSPEFLTEIPKTGIGCYPEYEYEVRQNDNRNPWELKISCPLGLLNWDFMFFWPIRKYPEKIYGGWIEPIGDWAYFHE
ncbi:MAG TPA: hypothetical protein V6C97_27980 [Oculatellaceae cyanobacterium]